MDTTKVCPIHNVKMTNLFFGAVCDICEPPKRIAPSNNINENKYPYVAYCTLTHPISIFNTQSVQSSDIYRINYNPGLFIGVDFDKDFNNIKKVAELLNLSHAAKISSHKYMVHRIFANWDIFNAKEKLADALLVLKEEDFSIYNSKKFRPAKYSIFTTPEPL